MVVTSAVDSQLRQFLTCQTALLANDVGYAATLFAKQGVADPGLFAFVHNVNLGIAEVAQNGAFGITVISSPKSMTRGRNSALLVSSSWSILTR